MSVIKGINAANFDIGTGGKYSVSVITGLKTSVALLVCSVLFVAMIPVVMTLGLAGLIKEKPKA